MSDISKIITLATRGKIAIITLNAEEKLNALTRELYYRLSCLMREAAARKDTCITVLTGKGRYFSAYVVFSKDLISKLARDIELSLRILF